MKPTHIRRAFVVAIGLFIFLLQSVQAGGSVELTDIKQLLDQQPQLWQFFVDRLDISTHGGGLRLGSEGIPLRGYRVAPYEFLAKPKGSSGDYTFKVTITADIYFLDAHGKEVTDEKKAVRVHEVLTGICLGPLKAPTRK